MSESKKALKLRIKQLENELDVMRNKCDQHERDYNELLHQLKQLQRDRFGSKSERYVDPNHPQLSFDDWVEEVSTTDETTENEDNVVSIASYKRRKKAKRDFCESLPRKEIIIPVANEDQVCACGCQKVVINHTDHKRLHYIPPVYEVHIERREIMACPKHCQGAMVTAPKPKRILPKTKFTESILAHIIVSKLDDRQPYYHLEKQFKSRAGFDFSRQTMTKATIECSKALQPLVNLMKDEMIGYDVGSLDATTFQVLKEPERSPTTKSYAYCMRGGPPGKEAIVYEYNASNHKEFVQNWWSGFRGMLHCDADSFFDYLFKPTWVIESNCNSHARRKFEPTARATKYVPGLAQQALLFYKRLYRIEAKAKNEGMTAAQRYKLRQKYSKPIMIEFKQWLDKHIQQTVPKSPLRTAMNYCLKHWDGLCCFLNDGRLEIDNNLTEQEIKPFVMARKNFLFACSVAGAKALCLHMSLIRTAKKHGLDPYWYYVTILERIPHCETVEDYEALLPWNIEINKVGSVNSAA